MKKIGFLGIMLIAAQNLTIAQTSFDVNIGSGAWTTFCQPFIVENHFVGNPSVSTTNHLGFGMKSVLSSNLTLSVGVRGHYMNQNSSFRASLKCKYPDCDICEDFDDNGFFINWDEEDGIGEKTVGRKESSTDYAMVSVPVKIGYQIGKFNPNFGVEYNYRVGIDKNVGELHSVGITTGLRFDLNNHFAFSTDFYSGVTKDMTHKGTVYSGKRGEDDAEKIEIRDFNWRTYRVELSVHYKFGGNSAN